MFINNYKRRKKDKSKDEIIAELQRKTEQQDQLLNDLLALAVQQAEGGAK